MCESCWDEVGRPRSNDPKTVGIAKILKGEMDDLDGSEPWTTARAVVLEDWNVQDEHLKLYSAEFPESKWLAALKSLTLRERYAALAIAEGFYSPQS